MRGQRFLTKGQTKTAQNTKTATKNKFLVSTPTICGPELQFDGPSCEDLDLGCKPEDLQLQIRRYFASVTASGKCPPIKVTYVALPVSKNGCYESVTANFTATDGCGNTIHTCRTVRWITDSEGPVITLLFPEGITANANLGCNPSPAEIDAALGEATATDNCNCDETIHIQVADGEVIANNCNKTQIRTFTATDYCGNTSTVTNQVSWKDDITPPIINGIFTPIDLGCKDHDLTQEEIDAAFMQSTTTVTDECGGPIDFTYKDGEVEVRGCYRSVVRTWTAIDECGNKATKSRTLQWKVDNEAPVFTGDYSMIDLKCNPTEAAIEEALGDATATDNCGFVDITKSDYTFTDSCMNFTTRTFTAEDDCGNTSTISRTVKWKVDNDKPVITATGTPLDGVLGCNPTPQEIDDALGVGTFTDNCDGNITASFSDGQVIARGCGRSQTRTWIAKDSCDNVALPVQRTATWTIDETPPVFDGVDGNGWFPDVDLGCNPTRDAIIAALGTASATDTCSTPDITYTDYTVEYICAKSITRTFTAEDKCKNKSYAYRKVLWKDDTTKPVINAGIDKFIGCGVPVVFDQPTFSDNCGGTPDLSFVDTVVDNVHTRCWTATDECGNSSTDCQVITVDPNCGICYKGCSKGFWNNPNGKPLWEPNGKIAIIAGFNTGSSFYAVFNLGNASVCGLDYPMTMLQALTLNANQSCQNLARQAVAALLNAAAFGAAYQYPMGAHDFNSLKTLIRLAFLGTPPNYTDKCNCNTLAGLLNVANNHEANGVCEALKDCQQQQVCFTGKPKFVTNNRRKK